MSALQQGLFALPRLLFAALLLATALPARAEAPSSRVQTATDVLREIQAVPDKSIPASLLHNAQGIAVVPSVIKVGYILGFRHGEGVMVVRRRDGRWSAPLFVSLTGGSVGWQIGVQSTDVVLVFKNRRGVEGIVNGTFTLGVDGAVAAGPVGRHGSAATNAQLNASIYSYARSRGLFAGVSLDGSKISINDGADATFYGKPVSAERIIEGRGVAAPPVARRFISEVEKAERMPSQ